MSLYLKKIISITFLLLIVYRAFAPGSKTMVIIEAPPPYEPFKQLIYAIGRVETNFDTLAYNPVEKAAGYFQIRPIRINDYNKRTGSHYTTKDMFDYEISEKIFLYYASQIGPYKFEQIAKNWNGSGRKTIQYWKQVKKYL
jgi:hypothetical protein